MTRRVGEERWAAMRAIASGAPATLARMASVAGVNPVTVRARSCREKWPKRNYAKADSAFKREEPLKAAVETFLAVTAEMPTAERLSGAEQICLTLAGGAGFRRVWSVFRAGQVREEGDEAGRPTGGGHIPEVLAAAKARPGREVGGAAFGESGAAQPDAGETAQDLSRRLGRMVSKRLRGTLTEIEAQAGSLTKQQLGDLEAMIVLAEKLEARAAERADEEQTKNDEEIAGALRRIDERIVELAANHAGRFAETR